MIPSFSFGRCPRILFGEGTFGRLGELASGFGPSALLVTGSGSLERSGRLDELLSLLSGSSVSCELVAVAGEPSPELVDEVVSSHRGASISSVLAVGGGSALDAGKAISAMLPVEGSVLNYLEGVGDPSFHSGEKVPFIAAPTTAGTGSEATRNAVLRRAAGAAGFKVSLRHEAFVPDVAVIDPSLALTCPPATTAACGMDAFTQLLESLLSPAASPVTDALALSGLERVREDLYKAFSYGASDVEARAGMAYGALISGLTLANAGLGVVHGLAASVGGRFCIPHGVACGTLVGPATRANIARLVDEGGQEALLKYAMAGAAVTGLGPENVEKMCDLLVETIDGWTERLGIPRLGRYGVTEQDLDELVASTAQKNNPVELSLSEVRGILADRL